MRTKCIIFGEVLISKAKQFKQNLPKNYAKSTKIAITACKFSKFFRGSMPPDPPRTFLVIQSASTLFGQGRNTLEKNAEIMAPPPPFEISRYATASMTLHIEVFCPSTKHCNRGHPFFRIFRILRILRTQPQNPQRPKKRPPVGVTLFLGSCKRFAFSNVF